MQFQHFSRWTLLTLLIMVASRQTATCANGAEVGVTTDIAYKAGGSLSPYESERCHLDLYCPAGSKNLPCLVWFYGGGLTEGAKSQPHTQAICRALASDGILVVCADYRLSPKVKYPAYLEDAAAAVAWVKQHAAEHGGDANRVFVGGHSAGGYLTAMLGLDPRYLRAVGVNVVDLAGFIPISGQMMTHDTVREERGLSKDAIIADEAAPINHVHQATPPWLILYAEHDAPLRADENRFFAAAMTQAAHHDITVHEVAGRTHGTIAEWIAHPGDPAREQIVAYIHRPVSPERTN